MKNTHIRNALSELVFLWSSKGLLELKCFNLRNLIQFFVPELSSQILLKKISQPCKKKLFFFFPNSNKH